jgi:phosphonopyruvate decarboxylase
MISPEYFVETFKKNKIEFFTGVPDSLLKDVCSYLADHSSGKDNIIAANEGAAIGLASGYHLATRKIPVVYMQNSGFGNSVNPLMSLTDKKVYNIPLILLVGWRGEPGTKDEPQHIKQGEVTISLLDSMGIKYAILAQDEAGFIEQLHKCLSYISLTNEPFAFIVRKGIFSEYKLQNYLDNGILLQREHAIQIVVSTIGMKDIIVSTTGMISRELFEYRQLNNQGHERDFLTVGSMGHASQIALGIALQKPDRRVYCFDGDGAFIMHMGSIGIIGSLQPKNYIHVVFNNGAHDSVGGQPTVGLNINLPQLALSCGYKSAFSVDNSESLFEVLKTFKKMEAPILLEIKVKKGARVNLGRPTSTPIENKENLMTFLNM